LSRSNKLTSKPYWLIVKQDVGRMKVLTTGLPSGEEALPVFSFEDEAKMFLEFGAFDGWRVGKTTAGELMSMLIGPCVGVRKVALDPLPGPDAAALACLVSMERETFMESLLNVQLLPPFESRRSAVHRPVYTVICRRMPDNPETSELHAYTL
jgi:hypothetical protein